MNISDLESLLNNNSSPTGSLFDPAKLIEPLMPFIIISTVIFGALAVLYLVSVINSWRANRAIIEMHKILREMNERDKNRSLPTETELSSD